VIAVGVLGTMTIDAGELARRLSVSRYPRSSRYDAVWLVENMMGPCSVWLAEALTNVMPLLPGERVMDLGCGKAMSSIFLAREFGVKVEAIDLWIGAEENAARISNAGLSDVVTAVHSDATCLDFPEGHFDAIISIDAYHYFGTEPKLLGSIVPLLKPGGPSRNRRARPAYRGRSVARPSGSVVAGRVRDIPQPSMVETIVGARRARTCGARRYCPSRSGRLAHVDRDL
jgi:SAM-dependent methyltransferase